MWRQPMRMGAALLCAMAALTLAPAVLAAPKSRFNRHIDTHKLDEQLKKGDRDDADWHEDTWDWYGTNFRHHAVECGGICACLLARFPHDAAGRRSASVALTPMTPSPCCGPLGPADRWRCAGLAQQHPPSPRCTPRTPAPPQMLFVHFKDGTHTTDEETSQLSSQWAAMMRTGGVSAAAYPVKANQVIFTSPDGQLGDVRGVPLLRPALPHAPPLPPPLSQVMDFVQEQPETKKMTLKGQDYFPKKRLSKKARRKRRDRQRAAQRGEL